MGEYSIVRVADVPDMAADVGMDPDHFEIRFLREALGLRNFAVTFERFGGGWRPTRGHRHALQEEVYLLVSGRAQAKLDDEVIDLEPWTAVRVPPADSSGVSCRRRGGRRLRGDRGPSGRLRRRGVHPGLLDRRELE